MTEDELFEDVKYWKGRADAAEARAERLRERDSLLISVAGISAGDRAMTPEPIYAVRETSSYTYEVFDTQAASDQWLATFRMFGDALEFARAKQASGVHIGELQ